MIISVGTTMILYKNLYNFTILTRKKNIHVYVEQKIIDLLWSDFFC